MYRIGKCDGSHKYLNKSVQVYQGTDYPTRAGLRTESFPNRSHSQRAVTVIPCMPYVTGQVVGVPAPLELTSIPGQAPRQQVLPGYSRDSSTYTPQQGHWCGASAVCPFSQHVRKNDLLTLPDLPQLSPWTQTLPEGMRQSKTVFVLVPTKQTRSSMFPEPPLNPSQS